MRFSLRNRSKLINTFGESIYNTFILSLRKYFQENDEIPEFDYEGLDYKVLHIPNITNNETLVFVIYSRKWDILKLAFYCKQ